MLFLFFLVSTKPPGNQAGKKISTVPFDIFLANDNNTRSFGFHQYSSVCNLCWNTHIYVKCKILLILSFCHWATTRNAVICLLLHGKLVLCWLFWNALFESYPSLLNPRHTCTHLYPYRGAKQLICFFLSKQVKTSIFIETQNAERRMQNVAICLLLYGKLVAR